MGAILKTELSSDDCGQEVRILLEELEIIMYTLELYEVEKEEWRREIFDRASKDLKIFIIRNTSKEEEIVEIRKKLIMRVRESEEKKRKENEFKELTQMVVQTVQEAMRVNKGVGNERRSIRCFYCDKEGHVVRRCYLRRSKEGYNNSNKGNLNYLRVGFENSSDSETVQERGYRRSKKGSRIKIESKEKEYEPKEGNKRKRLNLERYVEKFSGVFNNGKEEVKYCKIEKCKIITEEGKKIYKKGQMVPQSLIRDTEKHLEDLMNRKVIRESNSEWRNPIRALRKPNGDIRLVSNLIALNDIVEKDNYKLANIRDVIRATQGANYMTVFDLKEGFYSIEIEEKDKHKTAFEFNGKAYEWNSMVMGYKNSPQILQRIMDRVFRDLKGKGVEIYMDDIVVYSKSIEDHDKIVNEVLRRLSENNMKLNVNKIQFCQQEVKLLGVTLNGCEIVPSEIKKNEALEFPIPTCVSEVRRFLGMTGWFRDFIKNYAGLTINLTDSLKGKNNNWKWTKEMNAEFDNLKKVLRELGKLKIADYDKEFLLRTDASDLGMGAVLLQKNSKEEWVPVQWASKKFTPTEVRYGISEKEMYAVFWGVKKFEYELRGRKFKIETDHKALAEIRKKSDFNNARINRWIEKIQEFDFEIRYIPGDEMVVPDALSRFYTNKEDHKRRVIKERRDKQIEGKRKKHVKIIDGQEFWVFDDGKEQTMPPANERDKLIMDCHLQLSHRGRTSVYYEIRKQFYWPGVKDQIERVLKNCETCQKFNRKTSGGTDFVSTTRYLEKVGLDLIEFREEKAFIVVAIDYFTRRAWARVVESKHATAIVSLIKELCSQGKKPEEIITDNGKEFCNEQLRELCSTMNIEHRKVGVESHRSNGRVERIIRTLREGMLKSKEVEFKDKVYEAIETYNLSFHVGLGCTPIEAVNDDTGKVMLENSPQGRYARRFRRWYREKFKKNQIVRVAKRENLTGCSKYSKGRFLGMGKVIELCLGDSYIVRLENGRFVKKRHYDLKGIGVLNYGE